MSRDKIMTTTQIFGLLSNIMNNYNILRIPQNAFFSKSSNIPTLSNQFDILGCFSSNIISQVPYDKRTCMGYSPCWV